MKNHQGKIRNIKKFGSSTPTLVPSFSSKGFPHVKDLHNYLKQKLTGASLVSAYDLHYGNLEIDQIYESDILFVDSGGYERNREHDVSDIYGTLHFPNEWNDSLYEKQVSKLKSITDIVLVNFDYPEPLPLEEQIDRARIQFEKFPNMASDFLCKPTLDEELLINVDDVVQKVKLLAPFDILGFTEKELGHSILERANNIYRIRKALSDVNLDKPIHIFGCLDPLSIVLFFLCGADIFDGLSWLRFSFKNGIPVYMNHYSISSGLWHRHENEVKVMGISENLDELSQLVYRLEKFSRSSDWDDIGVTEHDLKQLMLILEQIGDPKNNE
ncbi:hypothetical protein [Brevibacillus invocatus]|uniref:hypothetical protein n=1 Tax=Brevibacillus invocatus TaxID=173959 RepID=UPI00203EFFB9|nr:hypothetical protein [Brevibacillus invocatus]MCM3081689.1 hypothetical protein [Brevibacillus invocatus]MCM3432097.1 hypothetical protein [Brevibacillus invocatus]